MNYRNIIDYYVSEEKCFDELHQEHIHSGHKRERVMEFELKRSFAILRDIINAYLKFCEICQLKKSIQKRSCY